MAASRVKPDAVVLSVGGGGLLSGVVEGLKRNGWDDVPVLAVETTGAASLHAAVQAGHPVELERLASVATSLGAKRVADQALECVRSHPVHSHLVSDRAALEACERFLLDHRVLVEPACGAALALAYEADTLARYSNVLVVVCGGATATLEQIHTWLQQAD
ncbi:Phenylserine dehydratase [compost metagenome]